MSLTRQWMVAVGHGAVAVGFAACVAWGAVILAMLSLEPFFGGPCLSAVPSCIGALCFGAIASGIVLGSLRTGWVVRVVGWLAVLAALSPMWRQILEWGLPAGQEKAVLCLACAPLLTVATLALRRVPWLKDLVSAHAWSRDAIRWIGVIVGLIGSPAVFSTIDFHEAPDPWLAALGFLTYTGIGAALLRGESRRVRNLG